MNDVDQRLPRRVTPAAGFRQVLTTWKFIVPAIVVLAAAVIGVPMALPGGESPRDLTYTELVGAMDAGAVASLEIGSGDVVRGTFAATSAAAGAEFVTVYPAGLSESLIQRAEQNNVAVTFERARNLERYRVSSMILLQLLLFAGIGYFLYSHYRGQNGGGEVGREGHSDTSFDDVAGTQGAADDLMEVVDFLKEPTAFAAMGARVPKGVLLVGPPGTGKTLLARAVAGEAQVPFFYLSGSEVTGFIVGLGAQRVRSLFKKAKKKGGVIFIDEIDALGGKRGGNRSHNEDDRTLNQLLVEMDGFTPTEGVVVIAATNRPEDLDLALKRPGRFDRHVTVGLPTVDGREAILRLHAQRRHVPVDADVDFARLARLTPGSSGAELANLLNEAAIFAVRSQSPSVAWRHFESARDRMLLGKEREGFRAPDREWKIVAWHEAGHAVAGVVACPEDGLHKVTIQPRGRAMGVAHFSPDGDRNLHPKSYLEAQIIKALGGRVAEELVFGGEHVTGGAESDLVHVNRIARRMIYRLGMAGNGSLLVHDDEAGALSADTQARMDAEVQALLQRLYARTREVLTQHRAAMDALAQALLERETLDGAEALAILAKHGVVRGPAVDA
ncbi:MAG TPA: ATP-dependent metallopeptidase FtsH/Yme1/Tma family protein [Longimicrobiales bacterium]|nr:ATP-dependent metallopeptidase FtsH/Yme1/Tma family protein [Longimicrobiales bacterium]